MGAAATSTIGSRAQREGDDHADGKVCLWTGATHAHLVGMFAFGRFQSTVTAAKDVVLDEGPGAEKCKADAAVAVKEAQRLFDAWMVLAQPACVDVFGVVEACAGRSVGSGESVDGRGGGSRGCKSWFALKTQCFRAIAEEGQSPRGASLEEVLLLFKHLCRLGCRRRVGCGLA